MITVIFSGLSLLWWSMERLKAATSPVAVVRVILHVTGLGEEGGVYGFLQKPFFVLIGLKANQPGSS